MDDGVLVAKGPLGRPLRPWPQKGDAPLAESAGVSVVGHRFLLLLVGFFACRKEPFLALFSALSPPGARRDSLSSRAGVTKR